MDEIQLQKQGIKGDRSLALFNGNNEVMTARNYPQLLLLEVHFDQNYLKVKTEEGEEIFPVDLFSTGTKEAFVFKEPVRGIPVSQACSQWFSNHLGVNCELLWMGTNPTRPVLTKYGGKEGDIVSFADEAPILMISNASLVDLNSRLTHPVKMTNFRPNIVIEGCEAYEEENWKNIKVGECEFEVIQSCKRCVLTTIDPETGVKDADAEPLRTLSKYKKGDGGGVSFGVHLVPRKVGFIKKGDVFEIIN